MDDPVDLDYDDAGPDAVLETHSESPNEMHAESPNEIHAKSPTEQSPASKKDRIRKNGRDKERLIDRTGLVVPEVPLAQEQVFYAVQQRPKHHATRALFIGNLRRPVNAIKFQHYLRQLVSRVDPTYSVERAWMNRTRTHAVVLVNEVEAARVMRQTLNGTLYPDAEERSELWRQMSELDQGAHTAGPETVPQHPLYVDYIQVAQINTWIFEEDHGPRDGQWRVFYRRKGEHGEVEADHLLLEGDFKPILPADRDRRKRPKRDSHHHEYHEPGRARRDPDQRGQYLRGYNRARLRSGSPAR